MKKLLRRFLDGCALTFGGILFVAVAIAPPMAVIRWSFGGDGYYVFAAFIFFLVWLGGFSFAVATFAESDGGKEWLESRLERIFGDT